jgi:hypothetical protein
MIMPVFENERSLDTEVAGILKYTLATCDKWGYWPVLFAHHFRAASSHETDIFGSTSRKLFISAVIMFMTGVLSRRRALHSAFNLSQLQATLVEPAEVVVVKTITN